MNYYSVTASFYDLMAGQVVFAQDEANAVAKMIATMVDQGVFHRGWDFKVIEVKVADDGDFYRESFSGETPGWKHVPNNTNLKIYDPPPVRI